MTNYCMECGNKVNWISKHRCSDCKRILCGMCAVTMDVESYCIFCTIDKIKERKKELGKNVTCNKCGSVSERISCIFCPYCGTLLRHDKIKKLKNEKNK